MSEPEKPVVESNEKPIKPEKERPKQVVIRMWPKTPILYPMGLTALICGILTQIWGGPPAENVASAMGSAPNYAMAQAGEVAPGEPESPEPAGTDAPPADPAADGGGEAVDGEEKEDVAKTDDSKAEEVTEDKYAGSLDRTLALIFLFTLFLSLFTLCVNLDIRWGLIFISTLVIFALVGIIANLYVPFITNFFGFLKYFDPAGNAQFYYGIFGVWAFLMAILYMVSRFHYVRIEPNEVLVVGGMLERQQRYSTMRMRYTKEVQDVLEYYLPMVRSGRLILSFPEQNEAVIIDNVLNIKKVTDELDNLISSLQIVSD